MADSEQFDLFCTGYRLRKATRRATQLFDQALEPHGLTLTQFGILAMLAKMGPTAIGLLADRGGTDRTTMTRLIKPLEDAGMVSSKGDRKDKRLKIVSLSRRGNRTFERSVPDWQRIQRHMMASIGRDETDALHNLLDQVSMVEDQVE